MPFFCFPWIYLTTSPPTVRYYRVIHSQRIQGDPWPTDTGWFIVTRYRVIHTYSRQGDTPKSQDTGWSIATAIIKENRVQGDHFFWTKCFGSKIFFDIRYFGTIIMLDPNFVGPNIFQETKNFRTKFCWDQFFFRPYFFVPKIVYTKLFWEEQFHLDQIICLEQTFFRPKFSQIQYLIWPKIILYPYWDILTWNVVWRSKVKSSVALLSSTCFPFKKLLSLHAVFHLKNLGLLPFEIWVICQLKNIGRLPIVKLRSSSICCGLVWQANLIESFPKLYYTTEAGVGLSLAKLVKLEGECQQFENI